MAAGPAVCWFCFLWAPGPPLCGKPGTGVQAGITLGLACRGEGVFSPWPSEAHECPPGFLPPSGMCDRGSKICREVDGA